MTQEATATPPRQVFAPQGPRALGLKYSRFVRLAKIALPLIALALVMVLVAWPQTQHQDSSFRVSLAALPEGEAGESGMTRARFVGTDAKDQPFFITAERAVPNDINPERITLDTLQADLTLNSGAWVSMLSVTGLYDRTQQSLTLQDGVDIFADNGFALHTASARIDLADGTANGTEPVRAQGPMGELNADSFRMERDGRRLFFEGNVRMTLQPSNAL
jgi:lipopolysaccharide export system protein LptC